MNSYFDYISSLKWRILTATVIGALIGFAFTTFLTPSYKAALSVGVSPQLLNSSLQEYVATLKANISLPDIADAELKQILANPSHFKKFINQQTETALHSEFLSTNQENLQLIFRENTKPLRQKPKDKNQHIVQLTTLTSLSSLPFLLDYTSEIHSEIKSSLKKLVLQQGVEKIEVAKARFESAKVKSDLNREAKRKGFVNDLKRAKALGFEDMVVSLEQISDSEKPFRNAFPRYFLGAKLLQAELEIIDGNKNLYTNLREYSALKKHETDYAAYEKLLAQSDFDVLNIQVSERPSNRPNTLLKISVVLLSALLFLVGYIMFATEKWYSARKAE